MNLSDSSDSDTELDNFQTLIQKIDSDKDLHSLNSVEISLINTIVMEDSKKLLMKRVKPFEGSYLSFQQFIENVVAGVMQLQSYAVTRLCSYKVTINNKYKNNKH
ncbi:hypothetical protein ACKWTF_015018 [Chironomus riparius]